MSSSTAISKKEFLILVLCDTGTFMRKWRPKETDLCIFMLGLVKNRVMQEYGVWKSMGWL